MQGICVKINQTESVFWKDGTRMDVNDATGSVIILSGSPCEGWNVLAVYPSGVTAEFMEEDSFRKAKGLTQTYEVQGVQP